MRLRRYNGKVAVVDIAFVRVACCCQRHVLHLRPVVLLNRARSIILAAHRHQAGIVSVNRAVAVVDCRLIACHIVESAVNNSVYNS